MIATLALTSSALACSFGERRHEQEAAAEAAEAVAAATESAARATAAADAAKHALDISASSDSGLNITASMPPNGAGDRPTFTEASDGSISITTRGGALLLKLRNDSVLAGFSDSVRFAVRHEVDSSMAHDREEENSALGKAIAGMVEKTVKGTLTQVFEKDRGFPVSALDDVRYEDGAIEFDYRSKGPLIPFEKLKENDRPFLEQFHPADAARFVGAVRAKMR